MRRTWTALVAGLVLAGCTEAQRAGTGPVVVTLQMDGGQCKVATPDTVMVRGGRGAIWQIVNGCDKPHRVTIRDFEAKAVGGSEWPFDTDTTEAGCSADAGKRCEIGLTVLSLEAMKERRKVDRPGAWVYHYSIRLDAGSGDPEIIIDWPMNRRSSSTG